MQMMLRGDVDNGASRLSMVAAVLAIFVAFLALGSVNAQTSGQSTASADEQILAGLQNAKKDGEGLVIVGGGFEGLGCNGVELIVRVYARSRRVSLPVMGKFFGSYTNIRPRGLAAGEWLVDGVKCATAGGTQIFAGPYASFTVQAGEIIDAGFLRIDYTPDELIKTIFTGAATLRLSVQPTSDVRLAELRKVIPRVMARAKKSHMVLLGSPVKKVKRKGLLD